MYDHVGKSDGFRQRLSPHQERGLQKTTSRAPLLGNWTALRQKFIDRYGLVNPAESLQRLCQLRQGSDKAVANVAQRARDLLIEAHVEHDKMKIHKFIMLGSGVLCRSSSISSGPKRLRRRWKSPWH
jgi:hypothetical protein